jgi:hypothetical protein
MGLTILGKLGWTIKKKVYFYVKNFANVKNTFCFLVVGIEPTNLEITRRVIYHCATTLAL